MATPGLIERVKAVRPLLDFASAAAAASATPLSSSFLGGQINQLMNEQTKTQNEKKERIRSSIELVHIPNT